MTKLPKIPGYRMIKKLGQGGMADVYLGVQEKLQRHVAVKVMIPSLFRDELFSKRFIKEAQTAAQLNHPNIITIHDVGEAEDSYFIVMEYLEESLSNRLRQTGCLPPKKALEIVKMIAGALDYAHKKGFIHRDIKPDNIMFRSDGTVVLVDFGIARAIDSSTHLTRTGMSIGTPHYMSPEQCKGEKIDGRSDIYSLGVQFYEILTGDVPYKAENTAGIIIKHIQDPVPRLPDSLSQYQLLIDKMMAKDRDKRIQSGAELIKFIDGLLTAQEFMPPPKTLPEETITLEEPTIQSVVPSTIDLSTERQERKKWLGPAVAAVIVVIVVAVTLYFITWKPGEDIDKTGLPIRQQSEPQEKKELIDQPPVEKEKTTETKKDAPALTGEEKEPIDTGTKTETKPDKKRGPDIDKAIDKSKREIKKKEPEPVEKKIDTKEVKPGEKQEKTEPVKVEKKQVPSSQVKTVNLLEVSPSIRRTYTSMVQRIQIPVLAVRFQVHGQVTLDLLINENGRVTVVSFNEMLTVQPAARKQQVIKAIKRKINNISLVPPKDKQGNPVRFNWRVTFKVGKYYNKIILTKQ